MLELLYPLRFRHAGRALPGAAALISDAGLASASRPRSTDCSWSSPRCRTRRFTRATATDQALRWPGTFAGCSTDRQ